MNSFFVASVVWLKLNASLMRLNLFYLSFTCKHEDFNKGTFKNGKTERFKLTRLLYNTDFGLFGFFLIFFRSKTLFFMLIL